MSRKTSHFISPLVACLLGMGLTTAWFHARKPAKIFHGDRATKAPLQAAESKTDGQSTSMNTTSGPPWKRKDPTTPRALWESEVTKWRLDVDPFASPETLVEARHAIRMRALELTTLLGLSPSQTKSLLTALAADRDPFERSRVDVWSEESLTPEQAAIYQRKTTSETRRSAELLALPVVGEYSRAVELSEQQRIELFIMETERILEFLDNRSENPFYEPPPELLRAGPSMILSKAQFQAYEEFKRRTKEIDDSYFEEIKTLRLPPD